METAILRRTTAVTPKIALCAAYGGSRCRDRDGKGYDLNSGPLLGKILLFALPIMAMNLLQLLFNAADMVVVGRFAGRDALAAVGATGALINLIVNFFMGLSVGTSVVVAQDYGADRVADVSRTVKHRSSSDRGGLLSLTSGCFFASPVPYGDTGYIDSDPVNCASIFSAYRPA